MTNTEDITPAGENPKTAGLRHMRPQPPRTLGKGNMGRGVGFNNKMPIRRGNRGR